jgi:hypothetical protein
VTVDLFEFAALNLFAESGRRQRLDGARPFNMNLFDSSPFHTGGAELAADRFNFGQFRHMEKALDLRL